jgi:hypothetical protein
MLGIAGAYSARAVQEITNLRIANSFRLACFQPALRAFMVRDKPDGNALFSGTLGAAFV